MSDGALRLGHPGELVDLPPSSDASPTPAAALARVVGSDADGRVLVTLPAEPERRLAARTIVALSPAEIAAEPEVLLLFTGAEEPVVVGRLRPAPAPGELEALVDGERVLIDANDEIVLRCGESSITLRRNGRVVIRGKYVETRSSGVNRIKGGTVQIN